MVEGLLLYFSWIWQHMELNPIFAFFIIYFWINIFAEITNIKNISYKIKLFIIISLVTFPMFTILGGFIILGVFASIDIVRDLIKKVITILE